MPQLARKHCIKTGNFTEKIIYTCGLIAVKSLQAYDPL